VDSDGSIGTSTVKLPANTNIDDLLDSIAKGKELDSDIFETIKSVAKNGGVADDDILAEPSSGAVPAERVQFECPVCGTAVDEDANACPSCGAEFAEEVAEQSECPACGTLVDASVAACPSCGVTFVEEAASEGPHPQPRAVTVAPTAAAGEAEAHALAALTGRLKAVRDARSGVPAPVPAADRKSLYKELPRLVNDVKPMLLSARKVGVDIEEPKRMINEAIAAGKQREIDKAVALVSQSKAALERSFTAQVAGAGEGVIGDLEKAKSAGPGSSAVRALLDDSISRLEQGDFLVASEKAVAAREEFEKLAGGYHRAKESLARAESLLEDGRTFNLDVREGERYVRQGREALGRREYDNAVWFADQARGALMKVLPDFLNDEMKRARNKLLDMKVKGGDLTRSIGILKQASIHLKREEYGDAMKYVRMFRRETEREPEKERPAQVGPRSKK
jgi:rubrerythrin